jgi:hypothetical protein
VGEGAIHYRELVLEAGEWGGAQSCAVTLEGGEVFCEGLPGLGRLFHKEHVGCWVLARVLSGWACVLQEYMWQADVCMKEPQCGGSCLGHKYCAGALGVGGFP